eukprot:TRINITY_DN14723_c0_g1_i1.p1 TRINITY_DN14723_c0_g1~~TRINITY_DN14723_c0_g1_i1.p1  ORF type:complete len:471 (-),score=56.99 TRINITY_DN14723_c0_g1_i1:384-1796(-)
MWVLLNSKSTSWNIVERLLFPAPAASYSLESFPDELILIPRDDGEKVPCLFLPFRHARFLVIYFHANAEDLGLCHGFCTIIRDLFQVHILAVEYPGYGICPGRTDEAGIIANAFAAMRFATQTLGWPCDGIKVFGRSLGTGPAIQLAAEYDVAGVILVSPFTSIRKLFQSQVGSLATMVEDRFPSAQLAEKIVSPTLIIHGQQDTLIPIEHGKELYEIVQTRKMIVCPALMGHNTSLIRHVGTFVLPMTQFFSLPDYTFEDIKVPAWAFPDIDRGSARGHETPREDDCFLTARNTPRPRLSAGAQAVDARTSPPEFPLHISLSCSAADEELLSQVMAPAEVAEDTASGRRVEGESASQSTSVSAATSLSVVQPLSLPGPHAPPPVEEKDEMFEPQLWPHDGKHCHGGDSQRSSSQKECFTERDTANGGDRSRTDANGEEPQARDGVGFEQSPCGTFSLHEVPSCGRKFRL